jgi:hypothetical protein
MNIIEDLVRCNHVKWSRTPGRPYVENIWPRSRYKTKKKTAWYPEGYKKLGVKSCATVRGWTLTIRLMILTPLILTKKRQDRRYFFARLS